MALYRCRHRAHEEKCALQGKFPVTKNGKTDCNRVRNAIARGSQFGHLNTLKKNKSFVEIVRRCGIKSKVL